MDWPRKQPLKPGQIPYNSTRWRKLRLRILQRDNYLCQLCLHATPQRITQASEVDHIKQRADGGSDDPSNLRSLCHACHKAVWYAAQGKTPKPRGVDARGYPIDPSHPWNQQQRRVVG